MKKLVFLSFLAVVAFSSTVAAATPGSMHLTSLSNDYTNNAPKPVKRTATPTTKSVKRNRVASRGAENSTGGSIRVASKFNVGPKPSRWCGWWMRTVFGGGPEYNLARNWAKRGTSAGGPRVGAVIVWKSHVGIITGKASDGRWIVKSGNDSNQVRERARSLKHSKSGYPIAFRML